MTLPIRRAQAVVVGTGPVRDRFGWRELLAAKPRQDEGAGRPCARALGEGRGGGHDPGAARLAPAPGLRRGSLFRGLRRGVRHRPLAAVPRGSRPALFFCGRWLPLGRLLAQRSRARVARIAYALDGDRLLIRAGWWRRRLSFSHSAKSRASTYTENFVTRWFGTATLRFGVAGGGGRPLSPQSPGRRRANCARRLLGTPHDFALAGRASRSAASRGAGAGEPSLARAWTTLVDELLLARGVPRDDLARHREPKIRDFLPDPSCFQRHGQGRAAARRRGPGGEAIAIFGDYDVDGATSAALLVLLLRRLGAEPIVYIPDRLMEGYGPSGQGAGRAEGARRERRRVRRLRRPGVRGARRGQGGRPRRDRRRPSPMREPAAGRDALINPNRLDESDDGAAHGHLAAVGMAFLLGVALVRELRRRGAFAGAEPSRRCSTCSTSSRSARWPTSRA